MASPSMIPMLSPTGEEQEKGAVWEMIVVLLVLTMMLVSLYNEIAPAHIIMITALVVVWDCGIVNTSEALSGFSNSSMIMVGCLFVVAQGVEKSHLIEKLALRVFGQDTTKYAALVRMMMMTFLCSAIFNNTPLVFILIPITRDWARSRGFAPSEFLIPLSFSSILGGCLTTIGTSTNLVINGLLEDAGKAPFGFIEPAYLGLPMGILSVLYLATMGPVLLPKDKGGLFREMRDNAEEMITEMEITADCPFVSKPISNLIGKLGITQNKLVKIRRRLEYENKEEEEEEDPYQEKKEDSPRPRNPSTPPSPPSPPSPHGMVLSSPLNDRSDTMHLPIPSSPMSSPYTQINKKRSFKNKIDLDRCDQTYFTQKRHLWALPSPDVTPISSAQDLVEMEAMARFNQNLNLLVIPSEYSHNTMKSRKSKLENNMSEKEVSGDIGDVEDNLPVDIELTNCNNETNVFSGNVRSTNCKGVRHVDIFPVPEGVTVSAGDIIFVLTSADMIVTAINDRQVMAGISILDTNIFNLPGYGTDLVELVVSSKNPFLGKSINTSNFGQHYGGSVVATRHLSHATGVNPSATVHRTKEKLQPGDLVMLLVNENSTRVLEEEHRKDFFAVSLVGQLPVQVQPWDYGGCMLFFVMLILLIVVDYMPFDGVQIVISAMLLMMLGGWVAPKDALTAIDFPLLCLIGSALGFARAVDTSGLALTIALFVSNQKLPPMGAMYLVSMLTMVLTNVVTNNAAAALVVPIALSISDSLDVNYKPLIMAVLYAASIAFMTPIGYQTNTMVWGPGGYTFLDFMKIGIPLNVMYVAIACPLLPLVFPFKP